MKSNGLMFLLMLTIVYKPFCSVYNMHVTPKPYFSIDTSRYAILKLNQKPYDSLFEKDVKPAELTAEDMGKIEMLIKIKVSEHNKESKYSRISNPAKYYKQLISVINSKGEKVIWVNCLCSLNNDDKTYFKNTLITVMDGGSCYFNLKINLTKNTVYDLMVNGVA